LRLKSGAVDLLELRVDAFASTPKLLQSLTVAVPNLNAPLLLTVRHPKEGGASALPGIEDAASRVFEVTARVGTPHVEVIESLRQPSCSTALGLLHQGISQQHETNALQSQTGLGAKFKNFLDRIASV
jgi:cell division ATPase FtsA